jgi:hypothetical protein
MAKTKTAAKSTKAPAPKTTRTTKVKLTMERAAAVDRNIGKSQPLHDFLTGIGWR